MSIFFTISRCNQKLNIDFGSWKRICLWIVEFGEIRPLCTYRVYAFGAPPDCWLALPFILFVFFMSGICIHLSQKRFHDENLISLHVLGIVPLIIQWNSSESTNVWYFNFRNQSINLNCDHIWHHIICFYTYIRSIVNILAKYVHSNIKIW